MDSRAGKNGVPALCRGVRTSAVISKVGLFPKFAGCVNGANWFKSHNQWHDRNYEPKAGDIIFFDWGGDGITDHVGIVEKCENGTVYTVEGNSGDACKQRTYAVGSSSIYGYGILAY